MSYKRIRGICLYAIVLSIRYARQKYKRNGEEETAIGVKKLKTQIIKFPMLYDPDLSKLIKTRLGNGTIQKITINLSSRNANATLKYDTEQ